MKVLVVFQDFQLFCLACCSLGSVGGSVASGSASRPGSTRSRRPPHQTWQGPSCLGALYQLLIAPFEDCLPATCSKSGTATCTLRTRRGFRGCCEHVTYHVCCLNMKLTRIRVGEWHFAGLKGILINISVQPTIILSWRSMHQMAPKCWSISIKQHIGCSYCETVTWNVINF